MNDAHAPGPIKITTGKCWQTAYGALIFQCSTHNGDGRQKGYLEINPSHSREQVTFSIDKPPGDHHATGVAAMIRKHIPSANLGRIAVSEGGGQDEFLRLTFFGTSADGHPSELYLVISAKPDREISVILRGESIGRLRESAQYTVKKPAPAHYLAAVDFDTAGFQVWARSCFTSQTPIQIAADESPSATTQGDSTLPPWQRSARDRVARRLKTLRKTLTQDQAKVPTPDQLTSATKHAELLRSFLWMVKPDMIELSLDEALTGSSAAKIELNPDLTPGGNLEAAFVKIKKLERSVELGLPRVNQIKQSIEKFESTLEMLRDPGRPLSEEQTLRYLRDLGLERPNPGMANIKSKAEHKHSYTPGRKFCPEPGIVIALGRNADESDRLVKSARSQDWWVHIAGGGHGSHVIVTGPATRDTLPSQILRYAGILALHFSDRGSSLEGEVYVARRQQIKKRKGMAPGLWQIDRAGTVTIRYEQSDLAAVFATEVRDGIQRGGRPE